MDSERASLKILLFPWLAHGHIFPYLELAKRILKRKTFHIYLCSTAINFSSINNFIDKNLLSNSIELVQLHLESFPELPPHYHTTKNLPSNLNFTLLKAFQTGSSSFSNITNTLRPDLVIYDIFQPWAAKLALAQGIPAVHFAPFGAATYSVVHHHYNYCTDDYDFPFPALCPPDHEMKSLDDLVQFLSANVFDGEKDSFFINHKLSSDILLLKTSRGFEGKYIEYYSAASQKKVVPVGPLVQDENNIINDGEDNSDIIQWLSTKTRFLEVKISEAKILAHPSIGGFVSHCGWSSINESIYFGVPVIGMPLKLSMFIDGGMLAEDGIGVEVSRDENNVYKGEELAKAINKVVIEKTGEELRRKAREVSNKMKIEEEQELDEAADQLWQLCLKKKQQKI